MTAGNVTKRKHRMSIRDVHSPTNPVRFNSDQQRGFPLRKYFIPGRVGRGGSGWDLRVCPLPAPAAPALASGNLGFCPLGIEVEKQGFLNGLAHNRSKVLAHNRSKVLWSWAEIDVVHISFSRSIFPFMSQNHERGCFDVFGVGELLQDLGFFKTFSFGGISRMRPRYFSKV